MKLNWKNTFFVGLAFFLISAFWQGYDNIVSKVLNDTFELSDTWRGSVMALDNVLALFMLPLFGMMSDKSKSRYGKRTPFIVVGTVVAAVATVFVAFVADDATRAKALGADVSGKLPVFIIVLFVTLVAMSIFRSPAVALMPDVTPKPLRSKANAVINLMGAVGGIIVLGLTAALYKSDGIIMPLYGAVSGLMLISLVAFLFTVKENKLVENMKVECFKHGIPYDEPAPAEEGSKDTQRMPRPMLRSMMLLLSAVFLWFMAYNAVTTSFSVYAQDVWDKGGGDFAFPLMVAQGAAIIMFLPIGFISSKIGRKRTILIGIVLLGAAFGSSFLFKSYNAAILGFFALAGVGWATINVNSYPMVVEMSKAGNVGRFTGFYYTASMAAQILTPVLSGVFMDAWGRTVLFPYAVLFMALAFVAMLFVRHGDAAPIKSEA